MLLELAKPPAFDGLLLLALQLMFVAQLCFAGLVVVVPVRSVFAVLRCVVVFRYVVEVDC